MHIAVIGAGVGGLATAIGLQRRGFDVSVYEQASKLTAVGAGVILAPNSSRLLVSELGIGSVPGAVRPSALHLRRWKDGTTITRQVMGDDARNRFGSDYLAVHRADLIDALGSKVLPGTLHLGQKLTGLRQNDDTVRLEFAGAEPTTAGLVVAADGIHSPSAVAIGVPTIPRASGYAAYRGLAPTTTLVDAGDEHTAWLGPDQHFVQYPVNGGNRLNFVAIVPAGREEKESWSTPGDIQVARTHFADWDPRVRRILQAADSVTLWGLYDRPVRDVLHVGRVVLLGDAAHPVLPFFAQGASLAIEDAAVLCTILDKVGAGQHEQAFTAYERARIPRVRKVQDLSHRNATTFHLPDGAEQQARDARLAIPTGGDPLRDNAWLYGHDARDDATATLTTTAQPSRMVN